MSKQERSTQFSRALMEVRSMVLDGSFPVGERLSETAVAEQLDVSRTPLRQALDRLIDEGLLERIETGGCRVASFSFDDIVDAIELRGVMEGTAARVAAERGVSVEKETECRQLLIKLDDAVFGADELDFSSYVSLNERFHELLTEMSGSKIIKREVERIARLPLASPSAFLDGQTSIPNFHASLKIAQAQHRAIFDAICRREGARAEALAREHARLARHNFDYVLNINPRLAERVPGMALVAS